LSGETEIVCAPEDGKPATVAARIFARCLAHYGHQLRAVSEACTMTPAWPEGLASVQERVTERRGFRRHRDVS
jgi:hypothetical protein